VGAWGFSWKTMLTWCKNGLGVGYWLRGDSEQLIIATRGFARPPGRPPSSVLRADRTGHSRKPRSAYPIIEAIGQPPRLEMFARDRRAGWASWGDDLSRTAETAIERFSGWAP